MFGLFFLVEGWVGLRVRLVEDLPLKVEGFPLAARENRCHFFLTKLPIRCLDFFS